MSDAADIRRFLQLAVDFGQLSGGQMRAKYPDYDPMQGYSPVQREASRLLKRLDGRTLATTDATTRGGAHD